MRTRRIKYKRSLYWELFYQPGNAYDRFKKVIEYWTGRESDKKNNPAILVHVFVFYIIVCYNNDNLTLPRVEAP